MTQHSGSHRLQSEAAHAAGTGDSVRLEVSPTGVGLLIVDRPAVRNALDWEAMAALAAAVEQAWRTPDLCALIVTGAGEQAFISGGDLRALHNHTTEADGHRQHDLMSGALARLEALPVPVIAAIEGAARGGGCEVALACDLRFAAETATLGFAQITMAVTPGWGGAERLLRVVGYSRALDLLLTGRVLNALEAEHIGLVDRVTTNGEALAAAQTFAEKLAHGPREAIRAIKALLRAHLSLSPGEARAAERAIFGQLWASPDHAEAARAFIEKRPPRFGSGASPEG